MSHDHGRKAFYERDRDRDLEWERSNLDYRSRDGGRMPRKRSRTRSPWKSHKDIMEDNILSDIPKMQEPNELWDNQFQDSGYPMPPPPPSFREQSNQSYGSNYQPTYSGIYDDFPPLASAPQHPSDIPSWNQMALPPPPVAPYQNPEDQLKKKAAIESELRHHKAALTKQREDYIKKSTILKKELETLKDQRNELRNDAKRSPSPDTIRFLKENAKLQLEIQNKLKTINNAVDTLNGFLGEEAHEMPDSDDSPERKKKSRSPPANKKFNYVYYDPEMHWCRICNEFPATAKDYLNHLHSPPHHKMAAQHMEAPWHSLTGVNEGFPNVPAAPTKRTPIRGLQFFVPSTAWYCKLCDQFIGDLHCASAHLKSVVHSKNYTNFVEQNPHWETDWMSDRQKALERARGHKPPPPPDRPPQYAAHTITFSKDGFHTKRPKKSPSPRVEEKKKKKDKKKKAKKRKESSNSSYSSSESSEAEPAKKRKKTKNKKLKLIDKHDDKALEEWMSNIQSDRLNDSDRKLLDSLKLRIKKDREEKHASSTRDNMERVTETQRKIRNSERRGSRSREQRDEKRERDERHNSRERRDEPRRDESRRDESRRDESRRDEPRRDEARRDEARRDEARRDEPRARERWDRRDKPEDQQEKKPEIKKMPFIGKMPVYKNLGKPKVEDPKKEEQKKKEDTDTTEKKKQEIDAEIQRKVAEFKEKIAKAQLERQQQAELAPPALALPAALAAAPPAAPPPPLLLPAHAAPPPAQVQGQPALPKDFQEALDIIFPSDQKAANEKLQQGLFNAMQQPNMIAVPPAMNMQSYPPQMGLMQPQSMFTFDMNQSVFPQPQLYDTHVPIMPNQNKQKQNKNNRNLKNKPEHMKPGVGKMHIPVQGWNGDAAAKKKEELDDLAMLGIDASDVGAGI